MDFANNLCPSAPRQPSQTCHMGSQTCCDCKDLYFGRTGLGRGEDAAGKQNPTRSPVNTLINNWQDYAKYDRSLILTRCSSLSRLLKHEQHHERKHRRPTQHNHLPLLPSLCQGDASLQPWGMMNFPLLSPDDGKGKVQENHDN